MRAVPFDGRRFGHARHRASQGRLAESRPRIGAIIALSPALPPDKKAVYNGWGTGKYDPRFNIDGKSTPLVLPPAYGLAHVTNETYTGEAPISYWNAYVAVTQMGGQGKFSRPEARHRRQA